VSLAPAVSATFGNLRYDQQAIEAWCHLGLLPDVGRCRVVLPAAVRFEAAAGDPAEITLDGGDPDGPGQAAVVLTGKVRGTRRTAATIEVLAADAGAELARFRPATTYTGQDGAAVVRALAGAAGADVAGADLDLALAAYVAHQGRTAAEHVALIATMGGATATVDDQGRLSVRGLPDGPADAALKWGRELVHYEVRTWAPPDAAPVAVGFGPAGSTSDPAALRQSADALSGGASDPGDAAVWLPSPMLRVPAAVTAAATSLAGWQAAGATRVRARCFLLPTLRPGAVVEIQDAPDGVDAGPWLITSVTHRLRAGTAGSTTFEGDKAGAAGGGAGGLLAAAAAVGSLL
jgi:hypothetical protein